MVTTFKVCERRGKSLWTPRQKFVNATVKVWERHGKSLWTPPQKFVKATVKVYEAKVKVCLSHGKNAWMPQQKVVKSWQEVWKKPRSKLVLEAAGTLVPVFCREAVTSILSPFALLVHYIMANRDNRDKGNDYV